MDKINLLEEIFELIPQNERPKLVSALHKYPKLATVLCELYLSKREAYQNPDNINLIAQIADVEQRMFVDTL